MDTIRLAEEYNEKVILLGDLSNKTVCTNWVELKMLRSEKYEQFKKIYIHLSPNGYEYELFCFERYFILLEYMEQYGLKECIMLDSDACTFTNYSEHHFQDYEAAASWPYYKDTDKWMIIPHVMYWKKESLNSFVDFLIEQYQCNSSRLTAKRNRLIEKHATYGISDMSLLYLWVSEKCKSFLNLAKAVNGETFDVIITSKVNCDGSDFEMHKGIKRIIFRQRTPYFVTCNGEYLKANVIHAQGERKRYIHMIAKRRCNNFYMSVSNITYIITQIFKRVSRFVQGNLFGRNA